MWKDNMSIGDYKREKLPDAHESFAARVCNLVLATGILMDMSDEETRLAHAGAILRGNLMWMPSYGIMLTKQGYDELERSKERLSGSGIC